MVAADHDSMEQQHRSDVSETIADSTFGPKVHNLVFVSEQEFSRPRRILNFPPVQYGFSMIQQPKTHHTDRKSTRLNSSHLGISYAVFCLKKKTNKY